MNESTKQKPLTPSQRHTLFMLYGRRLFYPHTGHATMKEFAAMLDISVSNLSMRLRALQAKGYITGSWIDLEFLPISWEELMK